YTHWSVVQSHIVKEKQTGSEIEEQLRDLDNALGLRGIVHVYIPEPFEFALLVGWEESSMPIENLEPAFMDADKLQVGAGVRARVRWLRLGLNYIHDWHETRTVEESTQEPSALGTYRDRRGHLDLTVEASF
ncbi:MAG: hypothetical protein MO852_14415, partial [Candidatus Devosia euplotis]|nr:hypothetical protein [Candidatus Devosia euplotis]